MTKPSSTRPWAPGDPDAEYEALLQDQAEQESLNVAASTARGRELYGGLFKAAQSRAESLGVTIQELYDRDCALIKQSDYPSEACVRPFEVEAYLVNGLAPERCEHVQACPACSALVEGAVPSATRRAEWTDAVRRMAEAAVVTGERIGKRRQAWLSDVFATGLQIGGLAALFGGITGSPPVMVTGIAIAIVASAALLFAHRERLSSAATFEYVWDRSRGAAPTAVAAVIVVLGVGLWQRPEVPTVTVNNDREPIEIRAASVATTAVGVWRSTGAYPMMRETEGPFTVSTGLQVEDRAVYEVTGDSQQFRADLQGDTGTLYRTVGGSDTVEAKIITGELREVSPGSITIEDAQGQSHSLLAAAGVRDPNTDLNGSVIAVTNPEMTQFMSVVMLDMTSRDAHITAR